MAKLVVYGMMILLGIVELNIFVPEGWRPYMAVGAIGLIVVSIYLLVKSPDV